jgi:hypothetical protein
MTPTMKAIVRASQLRRAVDELDRALEAARTAYTILGEYHAEGFAATAKVIMDIHHVKGTIR